MQEFRQYSPWDRKEKTSCRLILYTHEKAASAWLLGSFRYPTWSIAQSIWFCQHLNGHWSIQLSLEILSFRLDFCKGHAIQQESKRRVNTTLQMKISSQKKMPWKKLTNNDISHLLLPHQGHFSHNVNIKYQKIKMFIDQLSTNLY